MDISNVVESVKFLDFINNIDGLIYELLYAQDGYMSYSSKEAIEIAQEFIDKFDSQAEKFKQDIPIKQACEVISEKRSIFIALIEKHYKKQISIWAFDVYENLLSNSLVSLKIFKSDSVQRDLIYKKMLNAITWLCDINSLNEEQKQCLLDKFNEEFYSTLNSTDSEFAIKTQPQFSDIHLYLKIRNLMLLEVDEFISLDLNNFSSKLSMQDINYFNKCKGLLLTSKKTATLDELRLVNSAIDVLGLKENKDIYDFILKIQNDFDSTRLNSKQLNEQDKIEIVKRRVKLFKDSNELTSAYYKKALTV